MSDPGGAQPGRPSPPSSAGSGPPANGGSSNTVLIVLVALLLVGLVGGGIMFLTSDDEGDRSGATSSSRDQGQGDGDGGGSGDGSGARIEGHPPDNEGAHGVLLAYTEAVVDGDCETQVGLMSESFLRRAGDPVPVIEQCEMTTDIASSVVFERFDLVSEDDERVVYEVTSSYDGEEYVEEIVFVMEDGLWFVDSIRPT